MHSDPLYGLEGRPNRKAIWIVLVITVLIEAVVSGILSAVADPDDNTKRFVLCLATPILWLALPVVSLSYSARQCHDRKRGNQFMLLLLAQSLKLRAMVQIYCVSRSSELSRYCANPRCDRTSPA